MSKKYRKLTEHLASRDDHKWTASFREIERILGLPLPASARSYQAWWSNQMRSQSLGWQDAGWRATALDLRNEHVTFVCPGADDEDAAHTGDAVALPTAAGLTIIEAKAGLAATFGVDPSQVEITIRG